MLKMKDGGGGQIRKLKKLQYLCFADRPVLKKIWHGDVSCSSQLRQHIKFFAFQNSAWWPIAIWKI